MPLTSARLEVFAETERVIMDGYTSRVAADRPMFVAECSACPHSGLAGFALPWLARLILLLLLPFSPAVRSKILMISPLVASRSWSSGRSAPCRSTSTPTPLTRPTTCSKYRHRLFVPGTSARLDQLHELHPSTASINYIHQLHPPPFGMAGSWTFSFFVALLPVQLALCTWQAVVIALRRLPPLCNHCQTLSSPSATDSCKSNVPADETLFNGHLGTHLLRCTCEKGRASHGVNMSPRQ